ITERMELRYLLERSLSASNRSSHQSTTSPTVRRFVFLLAITLPFERLDRLTGHVQAQRLNCALARTPVRHGSAATRRRHRKHLLTIHLIRRHHVAGRRDPAARNLP